MMIRLDKPLLLFFLATIASGAHAQAVTRTADTHPGDRIETSSRPIDLSELRSTYAIANARDDLILPAGVAKTAVDHRFASGGVTGSAGFLCGLQAGPDNNGAASALGYDPSGRFVGAKLSIDFR
jgi:hypothetical protein